MVIGNAALVLVLGNSACGIVAAFILVTVGFARCCSCFICLPVFLQSLCCGGDNLVGGGGDGWRLIRSCCYCCSSCCISAATVDILSELHDCCINPRNQMQVHFPTRLVPEHTGTNSD